MDEAELPPPNPLDLFGPTDDIGVEPRKVNSWGIPILGRDSIDKRPLSVTKLVQLQERYLGCCRALISLRSVLIDRVFKQLKSVETRTRKRLQSS